MLLCQLPSVASPRPTCSGFRQQPTALQARRARSKACYATKPEEDGKPDASSASSSNGASSSSSNSTTSSQPAPRASRQPAGRNSRPAWSANKTAEDLPNVPKRGYFSIADPNAEVYSKAGEKFDPMKKPGRYKPEFIWNTNWQENLRMEESLQRKRDEVLARPKELDSGFLSLSRVAELDDINTDLSDVLIRKRKEDAELAAARAAAAAKAEADAQRKAGLPIFTRKEVIKLARTTRRETRSAPIIAIPELDAEKARIAAEEQVRYDQAKLENSVLTLGFTVVGVGMTYFAYSREIAISYLVGAIAGYFYLRLLTKSVDAVGADAMSQVSGAASQPRLLIPIILALSYNRFNTLYSDQLGFSLQLLPILAGFFTYKLALITRQAKEVYDGLGSSGSSK